MMNNSKKLQFTIVSILQFIALLSVLFVGSCDACGSSNSKKDRNLTSIPNIQLDKNTLSSAEENVKLIIQPAVAGETVNLERFTLKILYERGKGEISYKDAKGTSQVRERIEEKLTHFLPIADLSPSDIKEINFHIKAKPGTANLRVSFILYDNEANRVINEESVTWNEQAERANLSFVKLANNRVFFGKEVVKFALKNNGDKISTDDITVELVSKPNIKFSLGKKSGHTIKGTLTHILGLSLAKDLATGVESDEITLQLEDPEAKIASVLTLIVRCKDKELKAQLEWKQQSTTLKFLNLPDSTVFKGLEQVKFRIKNEGTPVEIGDIQIRLDTTNGVICKLGNKKGYSFQAELTEILGSKGVLAADAHTQEIVLEIEDPNSQEEAIVTLDLIYKGITATKTIKWQAGKLEIIGLSAFGGNKEATFQLKNGISGDISPQDIEIELASKPSGLDLEFIMGEGDTVASPATLDKLLGNDKPIDFKKETSHLQFKVKNHSTIGISAATIAVIVKRVKNGDKLVEGTATWTKKDINLTIDSIDPSHLQGSAADEFKVHIRNTGEEIEVTRLQLQFTRVQGTKTTIVGATAKGNVFTLDLDSLGNVPSHNSKPLIVKLAPNSDKFAEFDCQLVYEGYPIGDKKSVKWQGDPQVKISTPKPNLRGHDKTTQLVFTNEDGFELDEEILRKLELRLKRLTGDAKVYYDTTWGQRHEMSQSRHVPLVELQRGHVADQNSKSVNITLETAANAEVELELELVGSASQEKDRELKLTWKGEAKIKVVTKPTHGRHHDNEVGLAFINESEFDVDQKMLQDITIQLTSLTPGVQVLYGKSGNNVQKAKLVDVLGEDFNFEDEVHRAITIVPGTNKEVSFELELVGSGSEEKDRKIRVDWKKA